MIDEEHCFSYENCPSSNASNAVLYWLGSRRSGGQRILSITLMIPRLIPRDCRMKALLIVGRWKTNESDRFFSSIEVRYQNADSTAETHWSVTLLRLKIRIGELFRRRLKLVESGKVLRLIQVRIGDRNLSWTNERMIRSGETIVLLRATRWVGFGWSRLSRWTAIEIVLDASPSFFLLRYGFNGTL